MFRVNDTWEEVDTRDDLRTLSNRPWLRRHPLVEVSANSPLLHIDVMLKGSAERLGVWSRFIATDIRNVVQFLKDNEIARSRLTVQTPHADPQQYQFSPINKISEFVDAAGDTHFRYEGDGAQLIVCESRSAKLYNQCMEKEVWIWSSHP